jgi:hypothetical protein
MMKLFAEHGDGAIRLRYEYRPTTWMTKAIERVCGIDPRKWSQGWRWKVQCFCMSVRNAGNRFI